MNASRSFSSLAAAAILGGAPDELSLSAVEILDLVGENVIQSGKCHVILFLLSSARESYEDEDVLCRPFVQLRPSGRDYRRCRARCSYGADRFRGSFRHGSSWQRQRRGDLMPFLRSSSYWLSFFTLLP